MEALLAAVYLDADIEAVRAVFDRAWAEELATPAPRALNNPKSALQEWSQGAGRPLPVYRVIGQTGSDHAPTFTVEVSIPGVEPLTAQGRSRQDAEKAAATALLKREGVI
jgi:ribonuclease-3